MRNQKYLFLFQNDIQYSFLHQKDCLETKRIVVGPKHSALMFWHRNIVLRFQRFLLTWFMQFLYSLFKIFSSQVLTIKSLIWVKMITLVFFWTLNEILVCIWSITIPSNLGNQKYLFLFQDVIQHLFLPKKDRMDIERIVFGPKHSA